MAERKSVNKYYPPDWDPSKGSVNKYVGQHPLRDRARKLSQGILVIRFEMPYNIWCGGCNNHIGMGVRYNAEKTKTGMYYSTPIYKFRMKCHLCPNHFEIQTDPKNHDYVILEGARRKEQRWDPKENEQIVPEDRATHKKMATDAMFKLEHGSDDQKRGKAVVMTLSNLEGRRDEWKDDYVLNKIARQKFREEKVSIKSVQESDAALLSKSSLEIPLVQEKEEDKKLAQLMKYRTVESYDEKQAQKRKDITNRPIFQSNKVPKLDISPTNNKKLDIIQKHLRTAGNKSSPFDSGRSKFVSKSGVHQSSLGIRRKPVKSVVHTEKEMSMDSTHSAVHTVDLTETATDSVSDPVLHKGSPENDIRKDLDPKIRNPVESVQEEKEQISLYENSIIANQIIVNSPKAEQIDARSIKNEKTKSHNYGENTSRPDRCLNCAELVTEADKNDLKLVSCKSNPSCLKESPCSGKSLKTDKNDSEEDRKISVNEPKRSCDNMHVKETKIESCSTVCDRNTKTEDKTELETTAKEELVNKNYPEIKVDRKKLSLVAPYSDSESDSSS